MADRYEIIDVTNIPRPIHVGPGADFGHGDELPLDHHGLVLGDPGATALVIIGPHPPLVSFLRHTLAVLALPPSRWNTNDPDPDPGPGEHPDSNRRCTSRRSPTCFPGTRTDGPAPAPAHRSDYLVPRQGLPVPSSAPHGTTTTERLGRDQVARWTDLWHDGGACPCWWGEQHTGGHCCAPNPDAQPRRCHDDAVAVLIAELPPHSRRDLPDPARQQWLTTPDGTYGTYPHTCERCAHALGIAVGLFAAPTRYVDRLNLPACPDGARYHRPRRAQR